MRISKRWLEEWVETGWDVSTLVDRLTMAGLEVAGVESLGEGQGELVIGLITDCKPHPDADRLTLCTVDTGEEHYRTIVCGATNMGPGDRVPVALPGANLPNGTNVKKSKIRGVLSEGMLCSPTELGLGEESSGLLILPAAAPVGVWLSDYLQLDDTILELDLTPNRGDCLSIRGIAREVAALGGRSIPPLDSHSVPPKERTRRAIHLEAGADCPRYLGRVVAEVDCGLATPLWMAERLRRHDVRPINLVVDITNYVMLELGQPLHAFDQDRLAGDIYIRHTHAGEPLTLLDGRVLHLDQGALIITDDTGAQALAGIMGGAPTSVGPNTRNLFLECAFFRPEAVAGRARDLGLHTEASHRFERGVDPDLPKWAIERATQLIIQYGGGIPGPVEVAEDPGTLPQRPQIHFDPNRVTSLLGADLSPETIWTYLDLLGLNVSDPSAAVWTVTVPSHRFDLNLEADLVEEVARLHGYDHLPAKPLTGSLKVRNVPEMELSERAFRRTLVERGYYEVITYSFGDPEKINRLHPEVDLPYLANPLSQEQAVMRPDLWSGLLGIAQFNRAHQRERLRLFELGPIFHLTGTTTTQRTALGGLLTGPIDPPHWDGRQREVDFFDAKGDVEALLTRVGIMRECFTPDHHSALHPGQTARIWVNGAAVGWLGTLHPALTEEFDLDSDPILFQLDLEGLKGQLGSLPVYRAIPRFPASHRDLAVIVPEEVTSAEISEALQSPLEGELSLSSWNIFDVYTGQGVTPGYKSIALALTLQPQERSPTDQQIEQAMADIVARLSRTVGARLRS